MLSLFLAGGLTLVVAGGALIALWTRAPLLLPPWLLLVAAAAILLAWIARVQIKNAEGTLGGQWAANWALTLCVVVAPLYAAYYAATYFAITTMADDFNRRWLQLLSKGEADAAYWWTIAAGQRPQESQRERERLEATHNQADSIAGFGRVTAFRRSELVRLLGNAGPDATIDLVAVNNWNFEQGGYRVEATYRISSEQGNFQVMVATQGVTASTGELRGRQWHIVEGSTGRLRDVPVVLNEVGAARLQATLLGQRYLADLLGRLGQEQFETAFEASLSADDRQALVAAQERVLAVGLVAGPMPAGDPATRRVLGARQAWFDGGRIDAAKFWANSRFKAAIIAAARRAPNQGVNPDRPGEGPRWTLAPAMNMTPAYSQAEGGLVLIGYDLQLILPPPASAEANAPPFAVDAVAQVRFKPGPNGTLVPDGLERIELITGRQQTGRDGPGGMPPRTGQ
jgi:hypothetical protein